MLRPEPFDEGEVHRAARTVVAVNLVELHRGHLLAEVFARLEFRRVRSLVGLVGLDDAFVAEYHGGHAVFSFGGYQQVAGSTSQRVPVVGSHWSAGVTFQRSWRCDDAEARTSANVTASAAVRAKMSRPRDGVSAKVRVPVMARLRPMLRAVVSAKLPLSVTLRLMDRPLAIDSANVMASVT